MEMTITTPSLLFPAISLLLLAYTNRFVVLTNVIRQLSNLKDASSQTIVRRQIDSLRLRIQLIRRMQAYGVLSFVFCTLAMFSLLLHWIILGQLLFAGSLLLLVVSLGYSFYEVNISTEAINIELEKFDLRVRENDELQAKKLADEEKEKTESAKKVMTRKAAGKISEKTQVKKSSKKSVL